MKLYQPRKKVRISENVQLENIQEWQTEFNNDKANVLARNAVISVGSMLASTDSEEVKKVNHIFINSVKKHNLKATDQGHSGRCWMFAGLNAFRHLLIKALNLENFEFYLYTLHHSKHH